MEEDSAKQNNFTPFINDLSHTEYSSNDSFHRGGLERIVSVNYVDSSCNFVCTPKQEDLCFEPEIQVDFKVKLEVDDPLLTQFEEINFPLAPLPDNCEVDEFSQFPLIKKVKEENDPMDFTTFNGSSTHSTTIFPCVFNSESIEEKFNLKPCSVILNRIKVFSRAKPKNETRLVCNDHLQTSSKEQVQKLKKIKIRYTSNLHKKCTSHKDKFLINSPVRSDKCKIRYSCNKCSNSYSTKQSLLRHIQSLCFPKNNCKFCSYSFAKPALLNDHLISVHKEKIKRWECNDCGKFLSCDQGFHVHCSAMKRSKKQTFSCSLCEESFSSKCSLRKHCSLQHGGKYVCKVCNTVITDASNYYRHLRMAHGERRGKSRSGNSLDGNCICDICGLSLRISSLRPHQKRHRLNDPKPKQLKSMSKNRYLLNQKLLQLNIKLFKCEDCGALFKEQFRLNRHKNIHKGVKFYCELCNQKFSDSSNVRKHMLSQHNVRKEKKINKTVNFKSS